MIGFAAERLMEVEIGALKGALAYDEVMAAAVKRQHELPGIVGDLLAAARFQPLRALRNVSSAWGKR
jgi:hypothetical protein